MGRDALADIVEALPELLDQLEASRAREAKLKAALERIGGESSCDLDWGDLVTIARRRARRGG